MPYNTVPIVYGGSDYKKFTPPHSIIDAASFESIEKLAEYLKFLDENPREYIKYFWWKKYYKIRTNFDIGFCRLCEKLHSTTSVKEESYKNIRDWWFQGKCTFDHKLKLN